MWFKMHPWVFPIIIGVIGLLYILLNIGANIETKKIQVNVSERLYALSFSIIAYTAAFGVMYMLLSYLKMLPLTPYEPFEINQLICFVFCLLFGRSFAKWVKF